jgi:hypothetical protein
MSFLEMHVHIQKVAMKHNTQRDKAGREYLFHHAQALSQIRQFALTTQNQMSLQVYIYLGDQTSKGFLDINLLNSLTLKWHGMALRSLPSGGGVPNSSMELRQLPFVTPPRRRKEVTLQQVQG